MKSPAQTTKSNTSVLSIITKYSMVIALVVVFGLFVYLTHGRLLYAQNMSNLLLQNGYVLVMACGMLLCILTGGNIDLSVGSVICLTGGISAVLVTNMGVNPYIAVICSLIVGLAVGVWHGYWIGYVKIPPFITTLGGMFIFRGMGRLILDSKTVAIQDARFLNLFTKYIRVPGLDVDGRIFSPMVVGIVAAVFIILSTVRSRLKKRKMGYRQNSAFADYVQSVIIAAVILWYCSLLCKYKGINVMLVWVVAICMIYNFITSKTAFGRHFYAVGGNEKATRLSGINTKKVYFTAYASMGLLAGLCGLLCLARIGSVSGQSGTSYEMDAIGSCFIGGASAYGGTGSVGGVIIGALLLGVINMGMSILGISDSWQYVVKGGVLMIAVVFDVVSKSRNGSK